MAARLASPTLLISPESCQEAGHARVILALARNPPKDTDGRREESGRGGEGATGEIAWVPFGVGRSADGLHRRTGAPGRLRELRCAGWRENTQQGTLSDRAGASLRGSSVVRWVGRSPTVPSGREWNGSQPGKARLNFSAQGQRSGRCRVNRRAERVSRPAREKNRRRRVLVVAIRSPRPIRAVQRARLWAIVWTASQAPLAAKRPEGRWFSPTPYLRSRMAFSSRRWCSSSNSPSRSVMKPAVFGEEGQLGTGRRLHPPDVSRSLPRPRWSRPHRRHRPPVRSASRHLRVSPR